MKIARLNSMNVSHASIAIIAVFFSVFIMGSLAWELRQIAGHTREKALTEARSIFNLNLAYRKWCAGHGGVYVPITDAYQPNPYLVHPRREIIATDGTKLTLVNPATMTRNVHTILSASSDLPFINKVTSLKYMNPANAPDAWETKALTSFEQGNGEMSEVVEFNGSPYLRLLRPYLTEKGCLACHAAQGYKLGDVRGGLSVGVPMKPYLEREAVERTNAILSHALIWGIGMFGIFLLNMRIKRSERETVREEEKAKAASAEWTTTFEAINDCILILDRDYRIVQCNQATSRLVGMPMEQIVGRRCWELMHESEGPAGCPVRLLQTTGKRQSAVMLTAGRTCLVTADPIFDASGTLQKIVHTISDISEQKRLETELHQAQKMEAIGALAGGVAHDFNNILTAIIGYATLILKKTDPNDPMHRYVEPILASSERATALTKSLLSFSRKNAVELKPVNVHEIVSGFQKILARLIGEDVELLVRRADEVLIVEADRGQIEQVLMNLVTNARDAMPKGGRITIATRQTIINDHAELTNGPHAEISVTDTGFGMDSETQRRIFEPFYTTKDTGKGTGLGLAIVYGIIKKHNGAIHVESERGNGTTFKIYLPLIAAETTAEQNAHEQAPLPAGTGMILLAEDDADTRRMARILLEESGYTVLEAVDGEDAVAVFQKNSDRIQLVLADLIMPKKNGSEAYEAMRKTRPDLKGIFMSGYPSDIIIQKGILQEGMTFIAKPLDPTELMKTIREELSGTGE